MPYKAPFIVLEDSKVNRHEVINQIKVLVGSDCKPITTEQGKAALQFLMVGIEPDKVSHWLEVQLVAFNEFALLQRTEQGIAIEQENFRNTCEKAMAALSD